MGIVCQLLHYFPCKQGLGNQPCLGQFANVNNQRTLNTPSHTLTVDLYHLSLTFGTVWGGGGCIKVHNKHNTTFVGYVSDCMSLIGLCQQGEWKLYQTRNDFVKCVDNSSWRCYRICGRRGGGNGLNELAIYI